MKKIRNYVVCVLLGASVALVVAEPGTAATVVKKAITPSGSTAVSDEQQGILAVRNTKISVVSVIGSSNNIDTTAGTGFIITGDGYVVSNSHVVANKSASYRVVLFTGQEFAATVVGVDSYNDIALLKIDATNLAVVKYGNSDALETGQSVFAIGNSLGRYQNTVTRGVVSGLGRNIAVGPTPRLQNLIQTDASINPGNSGGPLVNLNGEVVGMNTLIDTEGEGLGFAIPINLIKSTVEQLKSLGKVARPYLGLSFGTLSKNNSSQLTVSQGAYVTAVDPNGPAGLAGVKSGDVITAISGEVLTEQNELDIILQKNFQAGNQILLHIVRGTQALDIPVILGEYK